MFLKKIVSICFFVSAIGVYGQEDTAEMKSNVATPVSIYVDGAVYNDFKASMEVISSDLDLLDFKFLQFNENDIANNSFMIDFRNIGRKSSSYYYDSYKNIDLTKHFPVIPDITVLNRFNEAYKNN